MFADLSRGTKEYVHSRIRARCKMDILSYCDPYACTLARTREMQGSNHPDTMLCKVDVHSRARVRCKNCPDLFEEGSSLCTLAHTREIQYQTIFVMFLFFNLI